MSMEKKILDRNTFEGLNDGIYELKKTQDKGVFYYKQDVQGKFENPDFFALSYLRRTQETLYLLEKRKKDAVLFFPKPEESRDFIDGRNDYEDIIKGFRDFTGCAGTAVILSIHYCVLGLSTFAEKPWRQDDFITCRRNGFEFTDLSVFEKEHTGADAPSLDKTDAHKYEKPFVAGRHVRSAAINKKENLDEYMKEALKHLTPKKMLSYCQRRIQGQGIELKKAVYLVYRYLQNIADGAHAPAENWMLTAPSGSGKTEFFRAVRDCFRVHSIPVPVVQIDLSQITETGFKGDNVKTIPEKILRVSPNMGGVAICFLDEADKKFIPSYASHNVDVNAAVQSNLLTLVEGTRLTVDVDDVDKDFDSGKTMFVFMGSFQSLRNDRQEKKDKNAAIGFGADLTQKESVSEAGEEFYEDLTLQDMIDFGMQEELAGRMVQVINFHRLSREDMRGLIADKIEEISNELGVGILFTDKAVEELLDISFGSLGVRRPMNMVRELVSNTVAEFFFDDGFDTREDKVLINSLEDVKIRKAVPKKEDCR